MAEAHGQKLILRLGQNGPFKLLEPLRTRGLHLRKGSDDEAEVELTAVMEVNVNRAASLHIAVTSPAGCTSVVRPRAQMIVVLHKVLLAATDIAAFLLVPGPTPLKVVRLV
jgi:hypothetical protein